MRGTTRSNDAYAWGGHYAVNRTYTANGLNQYTASGAVTPTYDGNGNLVSAGGAVYDHNAENRLVVSTGTARQEMVDDSLDRLFRYFDGAANRWFVYDGHQLIAETNAGGTAWARRYVFGPGADEPLVSYEGSSRNYLHADERGSIVAITDGSGAATNVNSYDEYGIPGASNAGRFQYTGQAWLPEVGLSYYRARFYSPTLGRFLQTDPIGHRGGMNLYGYVLNDPVNRTDPSGLCSIIDVGYGWYSKEGEYLGPAPGHYYILSGCDGGFEWGGGGMGGPTLYEGGTGGPIDGSDAGGTPLPGTNLQICRGPARILQGNSNLIGRTGGFLTPVTNHSAAIIPRQFGASGASAPAWLRNLGPNVSGWTDSGQYFIGLTDVMNHREISSTAMGAQDIIMGRDQGRLILEIVGGRDERTMVTIVMPAGSSCPANTR